MAKPRPVTSGKSGTLKVRCQSDPGNGKVVGDGELGRQGA
jgi:hypothetical protein